jgi:hypothetical protein
VRVRSRNSDGLPRYGVHSTRSLPVFFDDLTRHDFGNLEVEAPNFDALE